MLGIDHCRPIQVEASPIPCTVGYGLASLFEVFGEFRLTLAGFCLSALGRFFLLLALQSGSFTLALLLEGVIVLVGEQADA